MVWKNLRKLDLTKEGSKGSEKKRQDRLRMATCLRPFELAELTIAGIVFHLLGWQLNLHKIEPGRIEFDRQWLLLLQ